ncbi:MAG: substrate-binding domain-containing protein [Spirochaetes bacterium]|nr:substrate-binding domain-containing protein [Spirochaetota bacterium]
MKRYKSALKKNHPKTLRYNIGFMFKNFFDINDDKILRGMMDSYYSSNINLVLFIGQLQESRRNYFNPDDFNIKFDLKDIFDGIILWPTKLLAGHDLTEKKINEFLENYKDIPSVTISVKNKYGPSLLTDNTEGIEKTVSHLVEVHNCKNIAFIRGPEYHNPCNERYKSYLNGLKKYNLKYQEHLITDHLLLDVSSGMKSIDIFFKERKLVPKVEVDAIIAATDKLAIGANQRLTELGIKVPQDILLTGYDNSYVTKQMYPALTTVDTDFTQIGRYAIELLLDKLKGREVKNETIIPSKLIIRESCGCYCDTVSKARQIKKSSEKKDTNSRFDQLKHNKEHITKKIKAIMSDKEIPNNDCDEKLISTLIKDMNEGTNNNFLNTINLCIKKHIDNKGDPIIWHNVISEIRRYILETDLEKHQIENAENLFNQARSLISIHHDRLLGEELQKYIFLSSKVPEIGQLFHYSFEFPKMIENINSGLEILNVNTYYLSIFSDSNDVKTLTLIAGKDKNKKLNLNKEGLKYPTSLLLPDVINLDEKKYCFCVYPLYHEDNINGFITYGFLPELRFFYNSLSTSISSAIDTALLFLKLDEARIENEKLLSTIRRKNIKLKKAVGELNKANEMKNIFLANVSHEIRTPLNSIIGLAEIIKSMSSSYQINNNTDIIVDESSKLLDLINQILDISKIESGKFELMKESFDLYELKESIINLFFSQAIKKGLKFDFIIEKEIPRIINGDSLRLREILINLIGNAFKFTDKGSIDIKVNMIKKFKNFLLLKFLITDTGIGIPQDKQKIIFEAFEQVDNKFNRRYGGTGLGIAISKKFIEMMDGKIGVMSKEGQGSTFWFTARFKTDNGELKIKKEEDIQEYLNIKKKLNILFAEDNPVNQNIVCYHLNKFGCKVNIVDNGRKAIEAFLKEKFDVVLMDIQMPEMDGLEATKIIRSYPSGKDIPIIGFTAHAFESDIKEYIKIGINDVLIKPVKRIELIKKIVKFTAKL